MAKKNTGLTRVTKLPRVTRVYSPEKGAKFPPDLNEIVVVALDNLAKKNGSIWVEPETLMSTTGTTKTQLFKFLRGSSDLVQNSLGNISTRKNYEHKTGFLRKLRDSYTGNID